MSHWVIRICVVPAALCCLLAATVGCDDGGPARECATASDCGDDEQCLDGRCVPISGDGGPDGSSDGGDDAGAMRAVTVEILNAFAGVRRNLDELGITTPVFRHHFFCRQLVGYSVWVGSFQIALVDRDDRAVPVGPGAICTKAGTCRPR